MSITITEWQHISTAPKDRPILGLCKHDADKYWYEGKLTTYAAHCEERSNVSDGIHVLEWGGEYSESNLEEGYSFTIPNWWFRAGSHFEEVANPTHWLPIPEHIGEL